MDKKLFALYFIMVFVIISFLILPNKKPIFADNLDYDNLVTYTFYTLEKTDDSLSYTKNGDAFIVSCDANKAVQVKQKLGKILGESVHFNGDKIAGLNFISKFNYTSILTEDVNGIFTLYAYSPKIENYVYINNKKVNIELAVNKGVVTIGSPIIVGSY